MIVAKLFNYDTKELIYVHQFDEKGPTAYRAFNLLHRLESIQSHNQDILGIGQIGECNFGINCIASVGQLCSSMKKPSTVNKDYTPKNVVINGIKTDLRLGIEMYESGWILCLGKLTRNALGGEYMTYLKSMGSKNVHGTSESNAKVFKDLKAVKNFVVNHMSSMEYCSAHHDYVWALHPSCTMYEEDLMEELSYMPVRKSDKFHKEKSELVLLISSANKIGASSSDIFTPSEIVTPEIADNQMIKAEAIIRMNALSFLSKDIMRYSNEGYINMSTLNGRVCSLDENAAHAVEIVRMMGYEPYHVAQQIFDGNTEYAVLYVSPDTANWKKERMNEKGEITAYCYNPDKLTGENTTCIIYPSNHGGVERYA